MTTAQRETAFFVAGLTAGFCVDELVYGRWLIAAMQAALGASLLIWAITSRRSRSPQ